MNKNVTKLYYGSNGTLEKQENSPIHTSSNYVNVIEMYSENGNTNLMYISFQLPNGIVTPARPIFAIPQAQDVVVDSKTYGVYSYAIPNAITNALGNSALKCSFREYELDTFIGFYKTPSDLPTNYGYNYVDDYYAYVVSNNFIYKNEYNPDTNEYNGWVNTGSNILKAGEIVRAYGIASIPLYKTVSLNNEEQDDVPTDELVLNEIATLQAQMSSEVIARKSSDDTIASALTKETQDRENADTEITNRLDIVEQTTNNTKSVVESLAKDVGHKADQTYVDSTFATKTQVDSLDTRETNDYNENKGAIATNSASIVDLQQQINNLAGAGFTVKIVDSLPPVGQNGIMYLVPKPSDERLTQDVYDEYVWVQYEDNTYGYEHIGSTDQDIDLTDYYTKEEVQSYVAGVMPTKTSQLENDSNFQTANQVNTTIQSKGYQTETQVRNIVTSYGYQTADQVNELIETYLSSVTYNGESENL